MRIAPIFAGLTALPLTLGVTLATALADQPKDWQTGLQAAATPTMERINSFHNMLVYIIVAISLFVLALMVYAMVRFRKSANPTPSRTTHNTMVEVLWTVVPIVILVTIAVPSFRLLYFADRAANPEMTVKATGHQWYWSYEYPDHGDFSFDAIMVPDSEIKAGQVRLLSTDNAVVVPVDTDVRLLTTSADVIHSWAMPAFGVKLDANPGKVNETWFRVTKTGTYYGQCSELCGVNHGFMPIEIRAVSKAEFTRWVEEAKTAFGTPATSADRQVATAN
jgi:cytochrome c oxidase subunit II